jgi:DNA-binding transcriptional LysR family regulator
MMHRPALDLDVLRSFVTGFELGSFTRAADRLGRSQSALSTQLRRLEAQVGQPLVRKSGRFLALTPAGESLLSYARRLLELNDEAMDALRGAALEGWVRLGMPQDFADTWLPGVLGRFARAHPNVRIEVRAERNAQLVERVRRGELDLSLTWGDGTEPPHSEHLADLPVVWIGPPGWQATAGPLSLLAFEPPCVFRSAGLAALDAVGMAWRIAFISPSLAGLWAAAEAGLGITVRTRFGMPATLAELEPAVTGLPSLPPMPLLLCRAEAVPSPVVARLAAILREAIAERTDTGSHNG